MCSSAITVEAVGMFENTSFHSEKTLEALGDFIVLGTSSENSFTFGQAIYEGSLVSRIR